LYNAYSLFIETDNEGKTMEYLEYALWSFFIFAPVYVYLTHEQEQRDVIALRLSRNTVYLRTIAFLWLPTLLLLFLVTQGHLQAESIGLVWNNSVGNLLCAGLVNAFVVYSAVSLNQLSKDCSNDDEVVESLSFVGWLMPQKRSEMQLFVLGVSVSAGVCEELLFRGFLLNQLLEVMPVYAAVIVSSLLFGLPHVYQGPMHILRTAALGVLMAVIYLVCDSIYVAIILHALFDIYGGVLAYIVLSRNKQPLVNA